MAVPNKRDSDVPQDKGTWLTALFGLELRRRRLEMGLSQEELADRAGLDRTTIGRVERGEFKATLEVASAMANACGFHLWQLLREAQPEQTP